MSLQLTITDVGLRHLQLAQSNGVKLALSEFRVGTATGYVPSAGQTALNGSVLYAGTPTTFAHIIGSGSTDVDTLTFECVIPETYGDFDIGELGLYIPGTGVGELVLFAIGVFPVVVPKRATTAGRTGNRLNFQGSVQTKSSTASITVNVNGLAHYNMYRELGTTVELPKPAVDVDRVMRVTKPPAGTVDVALSGLRTTLIHHAMSPGLPSLQSEEWIPDNYKLVFMAHNCPRVNNGFDAGTAPSTTSFCIALTDLGSGNRIYDKLPIPHNELLVSFYHVGTASAIKGKLLPVASVNQYINGGKEYIKFTLASPLPSAPAAGNGIKLYHPVDVIQQTLLWLYDAVTAPIISGPSSINVSAGSANAQFIASGSVTYDPLADGLITYNWIISGQTGGSHTIITSAVGPVLDLTYYNDDIITADTITIQCFAEDSEGNQSNTSQVTMLVINYDLPTVDYDYPVNVANINITHNLTSTYDAGGDPSVTFSWQWALTSNEAVKFSTGFGTPNASSTTYLHTVAGASIRLFLTITNDRGSATDSSFAFTATNPASADPDSSYIDSTVVNYSAAGGTQNEVSTATSMPNNSTGANHTFETSSNIDVLALTNDATQIMVAIEGDGDQSTLTEGLPNINIWRPATNTWSNANSYTAGQLQLDSSAWDIANTGVYRLMPTDTNIAVLVWQQHESIDDGTIEP